MKNNQHAELKEPLRYHLQTYCFPPFTAIVVCFLAYFNFHDKAFGGYFNKYRGRNFQNNLYPDGLRKRYMQNFR